MDMLDIRTNRRDTVHHSLMSYLEALKLKRSVEAITLTTRDGTLVAAVGDGFDLERMGVVGSQSTNLQTEWDGQTIYTHVFDLNDRTFCLSAVGAPIRDDAAIGGLCRILGYPPRLD